MGIAPRSGRADIDNAPVFTDAMKGKITDPKVMAAFKYWRAEALFKWLALPPKTPDTIVEVYREAYLKIADDPDFKKQAMAIARDFTVLRPQEAIKTVRALADTSEQAIATMSALMRAQGLEAPQTSRK